MLRVNIHAGPLGKASRFNLIAWADIAYEKLAPVASYKTVLFETGHGATLPVPLENYPRWSASLWDLTARALALGLNQDQNPNEPNEAVPEVDTLEKGFAFANQICAVIEHPPATRSLSRDTLGSVEIKQVGRARGTYVARFREHTMPDQSTDSFRFMPSYLRPAELLLHACLVRLTGTHEMPPRPGLCVPEAVEKDGLRFVPIHMLVEPARTGFLNWLTRYSEPPIEHESAPQGIAPETLYGKFLAEAV
jgi:hypothetical protein